MNESKMTFEEASGSGAYVTLTNSQGKKLRLRVGPIGPEDLSLARERVRERTTDPLIDVRPHLEGMTEVQQKIVLEKAYEAHQDWGNLKGLQGSQWVNSVEGLAFLMWRSTVRFDSTVEESVILDCLTHMGVEALKETMVKASATLSRVTSPISSPQTPEPGRLEKGGRRNPKKKTRSARGRN